MTVKSCFQQLEVRLQKLNDQLNALSTTIGDGPNSPNPLADSLADKAIDARDQVANAISSVRVCLLDHDGLAQRGVAVLANVQEDLDRAFVIVLSSADSLTAQRPSAPEVLSWMEVVRNSLGECQSALDLAKRELAPCMRELSEMLKAHRSSDASEESPALDYSRRLFANYMKWYENADSKAQILLGLDGAFLAFLTSSVFSKPEELRLVVSRFTVITWVLLAVMSVGLSVSIFSALRCLWSRTYGKRDLRELFSKLGLELGAPGPYPPEVMWFFQMVQELDGPSFKQQLETVDEKFEVRVLASQIWAVSRNVVKKHFWVDLGFLYACIGLVTFMAAMANYVSHLR